MTDRDSRTTTGAGGTEGEPRRSRLGQILAEQPEARPRLSRAVSSLIGTTLVALVAIGILLIWHLRRRAQLIRDRLAPPRDVSLPQLDRPDRGTARPRDPGPGRAGE